MAKAKDVARATTKLASGPGGIHCSCCRKGPLNWMKRVSNRALRRIERIETRRIELVD